MSEHRQRIKRGKYFLVFRADPEDVSTGLGVEVVKSTSRLRALYRALCNYRELHGPDNEVAVTDANETVTDVNATIRTLVQDALQDECVLALVPLECVSAEHRSWEPLPAFVSVQLAY